MTAGAVSTVRARGDEGASVVALLMLSHPVVASREGKDPPMNPRRLVERESTVPAVRPIGASHEGRNNATRRGSWGGDLELASLGEWLRTLLGSE